MCLTFSRSGSSRARATLLLSITDDAATSRGVAPLMAGEAGGETHQYNGPNSSSQVFDTTTTTHLVNMGREDISLCLKYQTRRHQTALRTLSV